MRRVLIASSNPWAFAMAVERSLARKHADIHVDLVNLYNLSSRHSPHWRRFDRFAEAINRKIERFVRPMISGRDITNEIASQFDGSTFPTPPMDPSSLRDYRIGDACIGLAVLSSVTSVTTVQGAIKNDEYGFAFAKAWRSAHLSERIAHAVVPLGYEATYIFNGRHCYSRPFSDVLEQSAAVYRYEQGGAGNRYIIGAKGVHQPTEVARFIMKHDFNAEEGESFYRERLARTPGTPVAFFTASQISGLLPEGVEHDRTITFFTTSSDEMYAVSDRPGYGEFANQYDIALALADACREAQLKLVVRCHPHSHYKHESWKREWDFAELRSRGTIVVEPDDSVDSYALVRASRAVFTCGSTVGFEALYLGVPSAEVGEWAGGALGAMNRILTREQIGQFIDAPALRPNARELALRYGSYAKSGGKLLTEYQVGSHPYYDRIDGRIVDPFRCAYHRLREPFSSASRVVLPPGGKIMVEPSVVKALGKQMGSA